MPRAWTCCGRRARRARSFLVLAIDDVEASTRTAVLVREQFPHLRIFARARSRQHVFALMDAGVEQHRARDLRLEPRAGHQQCWRRSGETPAAAREAVRRFRAHDEATLAKQYAVKEDDIKFLATSREAAQQLEKLFESDRETKAE